MLYVEGTEMHIYEGTLLETLNERDYAEPRKYMEG